MSTILSTLSGNYSTATTMQSNDYDYGYDEEDNLELPVWVTVFGGVGMVVLILMAILGNLLVIISYFRDKQLQTVHNMYILNLAVTDFFIGAVNMLFYAHYTLRPWVWVFGRVFCKIWCLNGYVMCLHSIFLMLLLSLDRVILLRSGAEYMTKETKKVAKVKLAISWTLAFAIYGTCVLFWDTVRGYSVIEDDTCDAEFFYDAGFSTISAVFEVTVPTIILIVLNVIVFIEINKRLKIFDKGKKRIAPTEVTTVSTNVEITNAGGPPTAMDQNEKVLQKSKGTKQSSDKRNLKAAKFLAVLVVAFLICWGPYTITNLVASQCGDCVNHHFYEFVSWLLWSKSSINPFLYASQSKQFKDNFVKLLPFLKYCTNRNLR